MSFAFLLTKYRIPVLLFESVSFALLMHKVVRQIRQDHRVRFSKKTLLHVTMRDNVIYFAMSASQLHTHSTLSLMAPAAFSCSILPKHSFGHLQT